MQLAPLILQLAPLILDGPHKAVCGSLGGCRMHCLVKCFPHFQRQMLKFHSPFSLLHHCLRQLSSETEIRMLHGKKAIVVSGSCDEHVQVM